ncbi:phosphotransferase family protein [Rhodococcus sp. IEGM1428]|uniref:phosphotransferase family protein n=1 Tax=Rhodococcus sp. IEGM1428 TaxID=3392191 RepID=UPI003D0D90B4
MNEHPSTGIDPHGLLRWMEDVGLQPHGDLTLRRIGLGQSNLTYMVQDESERRWVVRRPPLGDLLASAHDVVREARIMMALNSTSVPVPKIFGITHDPDIAAAPVVLMDFLQGPLIDTMDAAARLDVTRRHLLSRSLVHTLCAIHDVDIDRVGLSELANHKPYAARQLSRWSRQWTSIRTRSLPMVDKLAQRLSAAIPQQHEVRLLHGDFHLWNMVLSPTSDSVVGVLDWELSTLGDPLADVGTMLAYWPQDGDATVGDFAPSVLPGFASQADMIDHYFGETGRDRSALPFWQSLGLWKLAIIAEGVVVRSEQNSENRATAGTPTRAQVDALLAHASQVASSTGI